MAEPEFYGQFPVPPQGQYPLQRAGMFGRTQFPEIPGTALPHIQGRKRAPHRHHPLLQLPEPSRIYEEYDFGLLRLQRLPRQVLLPDLSSESQYHTPGPARQRLREFPRQRSFYEEFLFGPLRFRFLGQFLLFHQHGEQSAVLLFLHQTADKPRRQSALRLQ